MTALPAPDAATRGVDAGACAIALETALRSVQQQLDELQRALGARDMPAIARHAGELQQVLSHALPRFVAARRCGGESLALRRGLALAATRVAAQRGALARAGAALQRAIDLLMPGREAALYSQSGGHPPRRSHAIVQA